MFQKVIAKTARALEKNHIPYMIIGGQAVLLYGTPRLTRDIDITLGVDTDRLDDIAQVIKDSGLRIIPAKYRDFVARTMALPAQDKTSGIRVDFIFSFTPYEQQAIKRAKSVRLGAAKVKFASVEDIIVHKIFSGRPRDLEDVRSIILKNPKIDVKYIRKWLREFDSLSEARHNFTRTFTGLIRRTKK
jgi:predicted nucleotidyltransferase